MGQVIWTYLILEGGLQAGYSQRPLRDTIMTQISRLIDFDDYIEGQRLTRIHQIVCGLSNVPLGVELQLSTDINTLDSEGRSALWYAVINRRYDYVCQLLEAGANPNIGQSPFLNVDNFIPVNCPDALAIDELLVKHGLDTNSRVNGGRTVLMCFVLRRFIHNDCARLKQLIELGSDIEIADEMGMTAIMYAVLCGCTAAFGVLSRAGARVDLKSTCGSTVLHLAVANREITKSIPRLCELFRNADLSKLDLDAKDIDGYRAIDLLRIRNGPNWENHRKYNGTRRYTRPLRIGLEDELAAISALEKLLHHVQEVQGVPEADRYPPLGEYCSRIIEEEPVPGSWPVY